MRRWSLFLLFALGCGRDAAISLSLKALAPASGAVGVPHAASMTGSFPLAGTVDFVANEIDVRDTYAAWLGETALAKVTYAGENTLLAELPADLSPGLYTLTVRAPSGAKATLPAAYLAVASCEGIAGCDDPDDPEDPEPQPDDPPITPDDPPDDPPLIILVTTGEDDPVTPPQGSLRAMVIATATTDEREIVWVPAELTVTLEKPLTIGAAVTIGSDGAVVSGAGITSQSDCLILDGDDITVFGLAITGCPVAAVSVKSGSDSQVRDCSLHGNGDGVAWAIANNTFGPGNEVDGGAAAGRSGIYAGASTTILGNRFFGHQGCGITVRNDATSVFIARNYVFANTSGGVCLGANTADISVFANTIDDNGAAGLVLLTSAATTSVANNSFTYNEGAGVEAPGGAESFALFDFNNYFDNQITECLTCPLGAHDLLIEPGYRDRAARDYALTSQSGLIDHGLDLGYGSYNGAAPDIGAHESP